MQTWTKDEIALLREMLNDGHSTSKIALALSKTYGKPRTRNSVIGYCHRHEIPIPRKPGVNKSFVKDRREQNRAAAAARRAEARIRAAEAALAAAEAEARQRAQEEREERAADAAIAEIIDAAPAHNPTGILFAGDGGRTSNGAGLFECKWIVDGGELGFPLCCGEPAVIGKSYCLAHYARAVHPSQRSARIKALMKRAAASPAGPVADAAVEMAEAA